ncbi:Macrolide export ATP-binding/permease protein MacB [Propionibacterium australiense]|uniref:FtsX-like permease family n=2 Tax=Propionibacterium australiense TaxID=119981 RepID=A0A383S711_9ACTN|nr:ABC transporter permease [Propionibacterium australiense]RLP08525.1 FtsX-like permease family protein [Propionibacterium australiense]RLP08594.1 FtsX-like permease family protein [Propionibacterium australiense]SYZ33623.1 FtsX-like permease family [Propionibacterium australiense]VEH88820.1 Macrolide export ATP-binding/permease protein MacB [Propionibacterium australiense]
MWKAAWKSLMGHKLRLVLSTLSVVLGIAFMSGTLTYTAMLSDSLDAISQGTLTDISVGVKSGDSPIGATTGPGSNGTTTVLASELETIRGVDGVESASGIITASNSTYLLDVDDRIAGASTASVAMNYYTEPAMGHRTGLQVEEGRPPAADNEIAVDPATLADSGHAIGDEVTVLASDGSRLPMTVVGTVSYAHGATVGASYLFFDEGAATRLLLGGASGYTAIGVTVGDGADVNAVNEAINEVLPDTLEATTGETTAEQIADTVDQAMSFVNVFLGVFAAIALIVAGFIIINTFSILVAQRSRELALYRALGASRRQVRNSVVLEAVITGLFGGLTGIALGAALAWGVSRVVASMGMNLGSAVPMPGTANVAGSLAVAVLVTVAAAWGPARRASKVPPVAAMSGEFSSGAEHLGRRTVYGTVLSVFGAAAVVTGSVRDFDGHLWVFGLGAFAVLIGVALFNPVIGRPLIWLLGRLWRLLFREPGKLAELNSIRQPRRTAATASALMIGLTLVTMLSIMSSSASASIRESVQEDLRGDFIVQPVNGRPLPDGMTDQIGALDGVADVHAKRQAVAMTVDQQPLLIEAYAPKDFNRIVSETMVSGEMSDEANTAIVLKDLAEANGLSVGDSITLLNASAPLPIPLTVTGIFEMADGVSGASIVTNPTTVEQFTGGDKDAFMTVDAAEGVPIGEVRTQIKSVTGADPLVVVQSMDDYATERTARIDQVITMVYALLALAIVIAVLGIVNTLALSIIERTREIGLLRAVGMKRRQIRTMITLESVTIALLGAVLGVIMGVGFGIALQHVLIDQGLTVLAVSWSRLGVYLVVAVAVGVVAALWPSHKAARLNMLEAIASE